MVRDELARATALLRAAGVDSPRLDAELLLAHAIGVSRAALVLDAGGPVPAEALHRYAGLLARRSEREPVAYLLGEKPFRRLSVMVDRRVLIPRPETELLVEVGLSLPHRSRVADVGTGSGAVALALADERPDLVVSGIDVSEGALAVARANGQRLGLGAVRWVLADLLDAEPYDAVLANLPYVATGAPLIPEITRYEPPSALFAGDDGLKAIRRLLDAVEPRAGVTVVALEVGFDQAAAVEQLVRRAGFSERDRIRDLAGHERVIVGRRG